jgi:uncharacterized membrane-anchored protein YitT (DUF2179 family)
MKKIAEFLKQTLLLLSGSVLCALAVRSFIMPHDLVSRGLTGLALIFYYNAPVLPVGLIYSLINVPVFVLGWRFVGSRFSAYSLWGMALYSLALTFVNIRIHVSDPMLAVVVGGALYGLGTALVLRSYGSSGGSEILCVLMNKWFSITVGSGAIIVNSAVLVLSALFFPLEKVLYTLVFIFISAVFTDKVFHGMAKRRTAIIVSGQWEAIAKALMANRIGVTFLKGQGGFRGEGRTLLYSVLVPRAVPLLKKVASEIDPAVFISIMAADDVTGVEVGNQPHW